MKIKCLKKEKGRKKKRYIVFKMNNENHKKESNCL